MIFIDNRKKVVVNSCKLANTLLKNGFEIQKIKRYGKNKYSFVFITNGRFNDLIDITAAI